MSAPGPRGSRSGPSGPTISREERLARGQYSIRVSLRAGSVKELDALRELLGGKTKSEVVARALHALYRSLSPGEG